MKKYTNEMKRCIKLAKIAMGHTSPNPMVGCLVINEKGKLLATGYHKVCGENHAERDALLKIDNAQNCTLIVNLEPCSHQGKTPPCTDIIIEKGIKRVVYGMQDPNPLVAGKGLEKLKQAGIEVIGPVMEKECKKLNEIFYKNQTDKKAFVVIKTATTTDGKIATYTGDSKWITSAQARERTKTLRRRYDAILTSASTVIADNPNMEHKKKIILDRELKTDLNSNIYKQGNIYIFHDENIKPKNHKKNITYIPTPVKKNKLDIEFVLNKIFELGVMSIFVEAGGKLNGSILPYADKIYQFVAPKILGDNSAKSCFDGAKIKNIADCTKFKLEDISIYKPDILLTYSKA
ncbi:bifunctional diaminohydroxyphosphoribosylaminopyrimidine deaminase/5-amino-6-(5-phosphoribosylamino)uracil reductase RibD [bacterium]|nr:bifunctional diaminohydroxyphosphoribosylaminopyrimidine deaminase/5-amino-6-(5-phosphoribosylamino)uracil reductase RibD [bacterium]